MADPKTRQETSQTVRRLPWSAGLADTQLAGGSALLEGLESSRVAALRWFCITPPALLLGPGQPRGKIDSLACAEAGVTIHRRGSGGGAVLGDEMLLLLDLALPTQHPLYLANVSESYHWIGEAWAVALRSLGLAPQTLSIAEARLDTQTRDPLLADVCFGGFSPYEVVVGQRKVVGLAQVRRRVGALFQCGVYLHWEPWRTARLMMLSEPEHVELVKLLAARVAGLDELLGREIAFVEVIETFETALQQTANLAPVDADWNAAERSRRLADLSRYAALSYPA